MKTRLRHRRSRHALVDDTPPIVRLWALRILVEMGARRKFLTKHGFEDSEIACWLGLIDGLEDEFGEDDEGELARRADSQLEDMLQKMERASHTLHVPDVLHDNVCRLADLLGLTPLECRLLEFVVLLDQHRLLQEVAQYLGDWTTERLIRCLSTVLDLPEAEINKALRPKGTLIRSGVMSVGSEASYRLLGKLELLSGLADSMGSADLDLPHLLRTHAAPSPAPTLALRHYKHLASLLDVLVPYLRGALEQKRAGVNILLYGPPGTGKSELARVLAQTLKVESFEVSCEDEDGDALDGEDRVQAYRAAQSLFSRQGNTLIVFDEVEDIFKDDWSFLGRKGAKVSKGWLNRTMENNPVPTIWLSNSAHCLDAAYIRRFDIVKEMPVPPKAARVEIIQRECAGLLDAHQMARLAESAQLAPAVVNRAAAVVRQVADELPGAGGVSDAIRLLIDDTLRAQGHQAISWQSATSLPEVYDPALINTDQDLSALAEGLARARSGRLCFYGPPGTGKTALGRWLAQQLDMPLTVVRASDLLSMFVGGTERNIADAFERATEDKAVLLIDEVDSFLQDRGQARHSWEITQINEMLTRMEAYSGIFIASTNLMNSLDQAALRRFDMKVRFGYLRPEQAWQLFSCYCQTLGLEPDLRAQSALAALAILTPGDYAAVMRRTRFSPLKTVDAFIEALEGECAVKKERGKGKLGFV